MKNKLQYISMKNEYAVHTDGKNVLQFINGAVTIDGRNLPLVAFASQLVMQGKIKLVEDGWERKPLSNPEKNVQDETLRRNELNASAGSLSTKEYANTAYPFLYVIVKQNAGGTTDMDGVIELWRTKKTKIEAYPDDGYEFDYWLIDKTQQVNTPILDITNISNSMEVEAIFKKTN